MPTRPLHACAQPNCPNLTDERYCLPHKRQVRQRKDEGRGTAAQRGYDSKWRRYRAWFLAKHPLCEMECAAEGRTTPATVVEHIRPHRGDQALFWDFTNHQAGCKRCADRKTAREDGGFANPRRGPTTGRRTAR